MTTTITHLALVPRDGFFVKDGRGWHTSAAGRGHGLDWPAPSTLLGALRSLWGRGEEQRSNATFSRDDWRSRTKPIRLGRTLVLRRALDATWSSEHTYWPVPLDAAWIEGRSEVQRLEPSEPAAPTLGRNDEEEREALWRPLPGDTGKPISAPRWWTHEEFVAWLTGKPVSARSEALAPIRRRQTRVGIRRAELTSDEDLLFSHDVHETLERRNEWALGVEVALPAGSSLPNVATLGSDSRLARVESLPQELFTVPTPVLEGFRASSTGLRLIAVSPLYFDKGWLPDGLEKLSGKYRGRMPGLDHEVVLRAAFVPRPMHVSGWDMAKQEPKPTSRMVPPGSVYFLERADKTPFDETDAKALWLHGLGARTDEGFGRVVPGVWRPARNNA